MLFCTCNTLLQTHLPLPQSPPPWFQYNNMSEFLVAAILLSLVYHGAAWDDKDFFKYCPPSNCSTHGPEIRFPFRLTTLNTSSSCSSSPCMDLACSGQDTILVLPFLGPCKVNAINYSYPAMDVTPLVYSSSPCPLQEFFSKSISFDPYAEENQDPCRDKFYQDAATLVCCPREFAPSIDVADSIAGPVSCLSNATHFSYLVAADATISILPSDCKVCSHGVVTIPYPFKSTAERIFSIAEIKLRWYDWDHEGSSLHCPGCERQGRHCAFSTQRNQKFCMSHGSRIKVIAGTSSAAAFVVLLLMVVTAFYVSLKTRYNEEIHLKVEMFLKTYGTSKPTRYTFSEVKKMARRFKKKVGQGGFGTVYKGELPNGVPVAVKMLENSTGEGGEFINEVSTIGRIHHANIVQLLGFCSEGTRRALIYEFMPNESLERYIFLNNSNTHRQLLAPQKMLDISLGIARGMEYLHQGCNQRILHFDIKPHNILLDFNFNPKISDFGLAKLCARDQSIVTLTAARGTMGYIAPELYSQNFGGISYKSDVYSFGMLVLEMVSGRRNSDPSVGSQNEVYLPEWIYEKVITGQELELTLEMVQEEKEKIRQLAIVGLWCIQWNPKNRPSMTKVVNMLTGRLQNLQMPPKPFI